MTDWINQRKFARGIMAMSVYDMRRRNNELSKVYNIIWIKCITLMPWRFYICIFADHHVKVECHIISQKFLKIGSLFCSSTVQWNRKVSIRAQISIFPYLPKENESSRFCCTGGANLAAGTHFLQCSLLSFFPFFAALLALQYNVNILCSKIAVKM